MAVRGDDEGPARDGDIPPCSGAIGDSSMLSSIPRRREMGSLPLARLQLLSERLSLSGIPALNAPTLSMFQSLAEAGRQRRKVAR